MPIAVPEPVPVREFTENVADKGRRASVGLLLPVLILGCIYGGITTPTEAAAVAVAFAIPVGFFVYKELSSRTLFQAVWDTGETTGLLILLSLLSALLASRFTTANVPVTNLTYLTGIPANKIPLSLAYYL